MYLPSFLYHFLNWYSKWPYIDWMVQIIYWFLDDNSSFSIWFDTSAGVWLGGWHNDCSIYCIPQSIERKCGQPQHKSGFDNPTKVCIELILDSFTWKSYSFIFLIDQSILFDYLFSNFSLNLVWLLLGPFHKLRNTMREAFRLFQGI